MSSPSSSLRNLQDRVRSLPDRNHPTPQFARARWLDLCGPWEFQPDPDRRGLADRWFEAGSFSHRITVPFTAETPKSGLQLNPVPDLVWYRRSFTVPAEWAGDRILLHFGAVDHEATVWINGVQVGHHRGGYTPFACDLTDRIRPGEEARLVVRASDPHRELAMPRGKQTWEDRPRGILYTPTTGIWQPVWLEPVPAGHLARAFITPDCMAGQVEIVAEFSPIAETGPDDSLHVAVRLQGERVADATYALTGPRLMVRLDLGRFGGRDHWWSPDRPTLFDLVFTVRRPGQPDDRVESYFGLRQVDTDARHFRLNGAPYYLRLALDQGYFPDAGLTPPDEAALRQDILLAKAMGFNGVRKHQKLEDPRFLYWCDRLGLLVWEEMPSAYVFTPDAIAALTATCQAAVARDYNHPAIVAWVPFNESWGVPALPADARQRAYTEALYTLTKALDPMRPVIANDGWEHTQTDIVTVHDYRHDPEAIRATYRTRRDLAAARPGGRALLADPRRRIPRRPVMITECGGIALKEASTSDGWGYITAESADAFRGRLAAVLNAIRSLPLVQGFCYTQLTDVEQEQNGLLTNQRVPKLPLEVIHALVTGEAPMALAEENTPEGR